MRFDTPIYFRSLENGSYNADTGDYEPDTVTEDAVFADVTESRVETLKMIYGDIKQGCYTVRLQNIYRKPFDFIRIGEKLYRADYERKLRTKHIFVVSEVK